MGQIRERMEADLKLKGFARTTRKEYLLRARQFVAYYRRSPEQLGEEEVRKFLLHLVEERGVRAATHRMYVAALRFLFVVTLKRPEVVAAIPWPKVPRTLPDILSGEEVQKLLRAVRSLKHRALLRTAYSADLQITDACTLEVGDIDSKRMMSNRCMSTVYPSNHGSGILGPWITRTENKRDEACYFAGGTVKGPISWASSTGSRVARVAAQYFGASSR